MKKEEFAEEIREAFEQLRRNNFGFKPPKHPNCKMNFDSGILPKCECGETLTEEHRKNCSCAVSRMQG